MIIWRVLRRGQSRWGGSGEVAESFCAFGGGGEGGVEGVVGGCGAGG